MDNNDIIYIYACAIIYCVCRTEWLIEILNAFILKQPFAGLWGTDASYAGLVNVQLASQNPFSGQMVACCI